MNANLLLNKLIEKKDLSNFEAQDFLEATIKQDLSPVQIGAILTVLRMKGETVDEILGLIKAMRKNMVSVDCKDAIDVCGTGGDGKRSFNISTAVAIVVAGVGVKVVKHGNRAASSRCGSGDVLEELGVKIQLTAKQSEDVFRKVGMVFLFAPLFHSAMKNVVIVRKDLKVRTIFNFIGPFANPAGVTRQLIGVPDVKIAEKLAQVGRKLNFKHLLIVTGSDGLDEISIFAKSILFEIKKGSVKKTVIDPKAYGFNKSFDKEILGGDVKQNSKIIQKILDGVKDSRRDIVVLNSAFALYAAGFVKKINDGIKLAEISIDSGKAKLILENLIKETQKYV